MNQQTRIFDTLDASDVTLAARVAERLGIDLPTPCIGGVAANVRLLQEHVDIVNQVNR